jgi:Domain found in Dishevelled, Egl-10, and Pleckstrin (DEP).
MARAGWVLRTLLLNDESGTLRDRKTSGGRTIARRCASGSELVDWLMSLAPSLAVSRQITTGMWQALLEEGVIYHGKISCFFFSETETIPMERIYYSLYRRYHVKR